MKQVIKRYRIFLLLVLANIIIGLILPDIGSRSLEITWDNIMEMFWVIPPVFILLGLMDVWVDRATMMKYNGKGSGLKGILISLLLGTCAVGPLYTAFPVAGVMLKKGSSLFNVFIFIGAWSTTRIPMLTFEAANMGLLFTLTRLALSITGIIAIAFITQRSLNERQIEELYRLHQTE